MRLEDPWLTRWLDQTQLILNSYRALLGRELMERCGDNRAEAERLFALPAVVLSHGTEADPILNYGNAAGLALWEMPPEALIALPSRLTAEPGLQAAREKALVETRRQGFSTGYEGIRISATGARFTIHDATIWNLIDAKGRPAGQAATFARWTQLPGV